MKPLLFLLALLPLSSFSNSLLETYFPLEEGIVRVYEVEKNRLYVLPQGEQRDILIGEISESFHKNPYTELELADALMVQQNISQKSKMTGGESHDTLNTVLTANQGVVVMHASAQDGLPLAEKNLITPPAVMIDFGKIKADEPFSSAMTVEGMTIEATVESYDYVTLKTALGELEGVLRYTANGTISGFIEASGQQMDIANGSVVETTWLAPGVGFVKQEQRMEMTLTVAGQATVTTIEDKVKTLTGITSDE